MSNQFRSQDEAWAWAQFFAAQCPKVVNAQAKNIDKEIGVAESAADLMLFAWRARVPPAPAEEPEPAPAEAPALSSYESPPPPDEPSNRPE